MSKLKLAAMLIWLVLTLASCSGSSSDNQSASEASNSSQSAPPAVIEPVATLDVEELYGVKMYGSTDYQQAQYYQQVSGKRVRAFATVADVRANGDTWVSIKPQRPERCLDGQPHAMDGWIIGLDSNTLGSLKSCDILVVEATLQIDANGRVSLTSPTVMAVNPTPVPPTPDPNFCVEKQRERGDKHDKWPIVLVKDVNEPGDVQIPGIERPGLYGLLRIPLKAGDRATVATVAWGALEAWSPSDTVKLAKDFDPAWDALKTIQIEAPCEGTYHVYWSPKGRDPVTITVQIAN